MPADTNKAFKVHARDCSELQGYLRLTPVLPQPQLTEAEAELVIEFVLLSTAVALSRGSGDSVHTQDSSTWASVSAWVTLQ